MAGKSRCKGTEQFITEAKQIHGDKYDYSKVNYTGNHAKVVIVCPVHGEFSQEPVVHLHGSGCPICGYKKRALCGVGYNDLAGSHKSNVYEYWSRMIKRCYYNDKKCSVSAYEDCTVHKDWHTLSSFAKWFDDNYVPGWVIDKDILVKGNKEYSAQACCFVPQEVNVLFTKRDRCRGDFPIGVSTTNSIRSPYRANMSRYGRQVSLGCYKTVEDAFVAYKYAKEAYIKELADKYKAELSPDVYTALYNYKVEITD